MANKHNQTIAELKTTAADGTLLEINVYYSKGGLNYFTGSGEKRGIYVGVTPIVKKDCGNGFISRSFSMFSGIKKCVTELARITDKSFAAAVESLTSDPNKYKELVDHVLTKNNLNLEAATALASAV